MSTATLSGSRHISFAATGWGWALLLALAGHGVLFQALMDTGTHGAASSRVWSAQPRWIDLPARTSPSAPAPRPAPSARSEPVANAQTRPAPQLRVAAQSGRSSPAPMLRAAGAVQPEWVPQPQALATDAGSTQPAEDGESPESLSSPQPLPPLPSYAARLPGPFELSYALRRGQSQGHAELSLRRDEAGAYELALQLRAEGRNMWQQSSVGVVTDSGLQPGRFTDRRRGRSLGTAQFDQQAAQVRFSGRAQPQPIAPAVQDRLSWLVQLPGVVAADAALQRPDAQVWLQVVGARGAYQVWVFENRGPVVLAIPGASGSASLHFRREPERPYDTAVDVWLDPAQGFLPLQIHLTHVPAGDRIELVRQP